MAVERDKHQRLTVHMDEDWQGGPAFIRLDYDEYAFGPGFTVEVNTASDLGAGDPEITLALGCGTLEFNVADGARLEFSVAGGLQQARDLRDAMDEIVRVLEHVTEHGWEENGAL